MTQEKYKELERNIHEIIDLLHELGETNPKYRSLYTEEIPHLYSVKFLFMVNSDTNLNE